MKTWLVTLAALAMQMNGQSPPPMFSPSYAEALRGVLELEDTDAARLERQVVANSEDLSARLRLMAYYSRADRAGRQDDRSRRAAHTLWLIEHHPESEILHSPYSRFRPGELTAAEYGRALELWHAAGNARPRDAAVQWNAATFFEGLDRERYLQYLEAAAAADPNHPFALRPLAHLYAVSIFEGGPLASRAHAALEASKNHWVLGNAAHMLQSLYNQSLQMGAPNRRAAELAERYFQRATQIDKSLDRAAILPQIDLNAIARAQQEQMQERLRVESQVNQAAMKIRRLPVDAFPELPETIAGVLVSRQCTIPQPSPAGERRNVIRGEFFATGRTGWAVLCSVDGSSSLIVFRDDRDSKPAVLSIDDDSRYVQDLGQGQYAYSREISSVGREFIIGHYRAYGGPEPPPIDHHGVDDAFLEKASVTWYFHKGRWRQLQGAD